MQDQSNESELGDTIPIFCTARIPIRILNEFLTEAFEAPELKAVGCTNIAIVVDTLDKARLTKPSLVPLEGDLNYPFLDWSLDALVKFASDFGDSGIVEHNFAILDSQTMEDKTVVLVTYREDSDLPINDAPRFVARADFRSSLTALNMKSIGVSGDEYWEKAEGMDDGVIRIYDWEAAGKQ